MEKEKPIVVMKRRNEIYTLRRTSGVFERASRRANEGG